MENFANIIGLCGLADGDENGKTHIWSEANPDRWARETDYDTESFDLSDGGQVYGFDDAVDWVLQQKPFSVRVDWDWPAGVFEDEPRCSCIEIKDFSDIPENFCEFFEIWGDDMLNPLSDNDIKKALEINAKVSQIVEI